MAGMVQNTVNGLRRICYLPSVRHIDWGTDVEGDDKIRVTNAAEHAKENLAKRSECSWESDAFRDIFAGIRDNPLLGM
jgi:hypothetical protein